MKLTKRASHPNQGQVAKLYFRGSYDWIEDAVCSVCFCVYQSLVPLNLISSFK
jgi:hypothetical protein